MLADRAAARHRSSNRSCSASWSHGAPLVATITDEDDDWNRRRRGPSPGPPLPEGRRPRHGHRRAIAGTTDMTRAGHAARESCAAPALRRNARQAGYARRRSAGGRGRRARRQLPRGRGADGGRGCNAAVAAHQAPSGRPATAHPRAALFTDLERPARRPAVTARRRRAHRRSARDCHIAHAPLEPRAALAEWQGDSIDRAGPARSGPSACSRRFVDALHRAANRVRVIVPDTGSAHGRQTHRRRGGAKRRASRARRGKPVKLVWTRDEEILRGRTPPRRRHRRQRRAPARTARSPTWEFHNYNSGSLGPGDRRIGRQSRGEIPPVEVAAAAGVVSRPRGHREPFRARVALWTISRTPRISIRWRSA